MSGGRQRGRAAWVLAACVALLAAAPGAAGADTPGLYVIGADDVLSIVVWNEADLSGDYSVDADGAFTFPMIGRVAAGGLTVQALEAALRERLGAGYLKNPQVSVTVDTYGSQQIFVMGEVQQPGMYPLRGQMLLIEALARAGSTTDQAGTEAFIVRGQGASGTGAVLPSQVTDTSRVRRVDLEALHRGELSENVALADGDTLFVPRAHTVYVSGNVNRPGAYPVQTDTTVRQAVILAGGVTDRGSASRLRIIRTINGEKTELKASEDDVVQQGDTIVVLQRLF